jgi:3alpha(or 20beta)-hydroxysteroid dehydrogenase
VQLAHSTFGGLDVLVNNAGIVRYRDVEDMPLEVFKEVFETNAMGCWLGMKSVIPSLRAAGGGSIVNTSSTVDMTGAASLSAYAASKWGIRGMTKCAALELGRDRIRVNSVHPGAIDTVMAYPGFPPDVREALLAAVPIPRIGRPEEVASLMVFLASPESAYCTGAEFVIDGGAIVGRARVRTE